MKMKRIEEMNFTAWKKIKRNGNSAKIKKDLVEKIIKPDLTENTVRSAKNQTINNAKTNDTIDTTDSHFEVNICNTASENASENANENASENALEWEEELDVNFLHSELFEERNLILLQGLGHWSAMNGITQTALNELLALLNENLPELKLPKDARTVTKTPTTKAVIVEDDHGGSYWHYGLEKALTNCLMNVEHCAVVKLNINVDGLPLFKSSRVEFWPILFNIHGKNRVPPMVAGIYCGKGNKIKHLFA